MTAQKIDGKAIADQIQEEIKEKVAARVAAGKPVPGLATVLVGGDPASQMYVSMKQKRCAKVGIESFHVELPADISQEELEQKVAELNADPKVNGILVQLPLPDGLDEERVLQAIDINKDVDGFHPLNIGRLAQKGRTPVFLPATPAGCIELLVRSGVNMEGANAVVLGRSNIVGMPVALLLVERNATVTICHSRTKDLPGVIREADILIAAVGRAEMVKGDWLKDGVVIIDVGTNKIDADNEKGYRWAGDVDYQAALEVASKITPVPRGVGPMTIAMLLQNTLKAAELADG
ncbi:MAG TPA: bifunctional methylenetetrahydrofolate dehydrogenase/methenyltetrahydrofolate cyclohydrolase FolD [Anaerolineales bacterium]|nr:bifunctional methylenetetrahydrofolate dehydrogenase/methenyltetrahydrofolate cyclohydrolase FolD [Anaerolineales bacterium]